MEPDNEWWLIATTPEEVHLYRFGHDDADTAEERSAVISRIRDDLEFPDDATLIDGGNSWLLEFAPGYPERYFSRATGGALLGVTMHEELPELSS